LLCDSYESATHYSDDEAPGSPNGAREILNRLLVQSGRAADRAAAKALQDSLSNEEISQLLRALSPRELIALANPDRARLYAAPRVLADGVVLPERDWLAAFRAGRFHRVPFITGTNRDERRLYQFIDPRWRKTFRETPSDYIRFAHYGSLVWKQNAVDDVARAMLEAGQREVYAYRFDWDEQNITLDGLDLSQAVGAAHAVELPFVFGTSSGSVVPLGDPDAPGRRALSASMMSYWAEHAYSGRPGCGRDGREVEWTRWDEQPGQPKLMLLDTAADGGVRMSPESVTHESIRQALHEDTSFQAPALHARLVRSLFD
jgi:para-nitrobenzyl esterase